MKATPVTSLVMVQYFECEMFLIVFEHLSPNWWSCWEAVKPLGVGSLLEDMSSRDEPPGFIAWADLVTLVLPVFPARVACMPTEPK